MEDGGWRMEDGGWRMEDRGWRMEDRRWEMGRGHPQKTKEVLPKTRPVQRGSTKTEFL